MYDDQNGNGRGKFRVREGGASGQDPVEQLIEEIRRFFKRFGGGGGNGGRRGGGDNSFKSGLVVVTVILLVIALLTSFYTVDVSEEGVVTRFGRYHATTSPGLHFKLPFGIDRVAKVPSKVLLQEEFGFRTAGRTDGRGEYSKRAFASESLMLTGDLNVADVEWIVQYRIADPWKFLFHARDVRRTIRDVSMSIMRRVVGDRLVGDVLTVGRVEIAEDARGLMQKVLDTYDIGINVEAVMLQDVNPPEPVKPAFNEVNAAKQEQEQAINNAEREYNKIIPEARGKAQRQIADAEAFAIDVVNRAKGDAKKFTQVLQEYRKAPAITRERMFLETMEAMFTNLDGVTIIDGKVKGVLPLYGSMGGESSTPKTARNE